MTANQTTDYSKTVSPEKLRKIMARVEHLLLIADNPTTIPAEAEIARNQAETYMTQYRIAESKLDTVEKARMGIRPTHRKIVVCRSDSEFSQQYNAMLSYVTHHVDGFAVSSWDYSDNEHVLVFDIFGFESDIAYAEMLWNAMRLAFSQKLEPTLDPNKDEIDNVYAMRCAGMERARIGLIMGWGGEGTKGPGKVTRLFKKGCERHGDDPTVLLGKGNNVKTYRRSFADAFKDEMWSRLYNLRSQRGLDSDGTLVLANRKDEVMELLYTTYPNLRPSKDPMPYKPSGKTPKFKMPKPQPTNYAAERRGREAAQTVDLGPSAKGRLDS
jgi:hypothetical protein